MKSLKIILIAVLTFLLTITSVFAGEIVANKDETLAAGIGIETFAPADEAAGYTNSASFTFTNDIDYILHIKYSLEDFVKPYVSFLGFRVQTTENGSRVNRYYSKEQAIEKFPTLNIINWSDSVVEFTIPVHGDANVPTDGYGIVVGNNKLPENIEAAYVYFKRDAYLYYLDDTAFDHPFYTLENTIAMKKIIDKKNVVMSSSIAKIDNGSIGEYSKSLDFIKAGDEVSVKVILSRPYGVVDSGKFSLTGEIPEGFSYVMGSASYENSAGYVSNPNLSEPNMIIDETTGKPILKFDSMPVGESTEFTFKMKALADAKNVTDNVVLIGLEQAALRAPAALINISPDWYPNGVYTEEEYTHKDTNLLNTSFMVTYDSNGGNGLAVDNNTYDYVNDTNTIAVALGNENIIKDGYKFVGWNTKSDGSGTYYQKGDNIALTSDTTLFAIWKLDDNTENPQTSDNILNSIILLSGSILFIMFINKSKKYI